MTNPNIIPITTNNPLAPRWRKDSTTPLGVPAGYREQFFEYAFDFLVNAGLFAQGVFITLDRDADFVLRQLEPTAYGVGIGGTTGAFRFRDAFGNALNDDLINPVDVYGPLFPQLILPAGSRFFCDFDNTPNAFQTQVAIILRGAKRFKRQ